MINCRDCTRQQDRASIDQYISGFCSLVSAVSAFQHFSLSFLAYESCIMHWSRAQEFLACIVPACEQFRVLAGCCMIQHGLFTIVGNKTLLFIQVRYTSYTCKTAGTITLITCDDKRLQCIMQVSYARELSLRLKCWKALTAETRLQKPDIYWSMLARSCWRVQSLQLIMIYHPCVIIKTRPEQRCIGIARSVELQ